MAKLRTTAKPELKGQATARTSVLLRRIVRVPGVMGGQPLIRGHRLSVEIVMGLLAAGWSEQDLRQNYPFLEHEDILACLEYAHVILSGATYEPETVQPA
jgi:uncharacterized protein (DUF433 family)